MTRTPAFRRAGLGVPMKNRLHGSDLLTRNLSAFIISTVVLSFMLHVKRGTEFILASCDRRDNLGGATRGICHRRVCVGLCNPLAKQVYTFNGLNSCRSYWFSWLFFRCFTPSISFSTTMIIVEILLSLVALSIRMIQKKYLISNVWQISNYNTRSNNRKKQKGGRVTTLSILGGSTTLPRRSR